MTGRIRKREQDPDITRRSRILLYVAFGAFALLLGRFYWLQVVESGRYRNLSENNRLRMRTVRAPRGLILDRKGRAIAETQGSFALVCSPVDVKDLEGEIRLLNEIMEFDVDEEEVLEKIRTAQRSNPYSSLTVARDLRFEQVSVVEFNRENLPGFSVLVEAKRSYPYGEAFAHVLGYVGEASPEEMEKPGNEPLMMGDLIGKYGLERLADNVLRGVNGGRKVEVDAAGRDQRLVEEVPSRTGGTVHTSLDVDLQVTAQEAMGDRAGAVIALAPRTGEVLAFYSGPGFDPNVFARGIRRADWQALNTNPRKPMQNKGLQGTYAPGSTIKPFLAMAALEEKMQEIGKPVVCPGSYRLGNRVFRCWKEKGHGAVDMYRAIVQSCDVYFYTLGLKLGPERVAKLERDAGLGTITGIDLPGERKGLVPDMEWKRTVSKERWYDYESLLLGIGQGAVHLTPLEMTVGYATLATGGEVMRPRVISKVIGMDGAVRSAPPERMRKLPWKPENVEFIRKALAGVVNDFGTGGAAKLPGIVVGGKTGTAQVASVKGKMIKSEHLPYEIRDHAWFIAFAPVDDPQICVAAMVEHGGHGGSAAAPIVKLVMQEFFRTRFVGPPRKGGA
ncbi:MAG: penicillin-binding protein 2 [Deltaproteobacteria bacterium RBG_16_66_15]|nr:MAG: penicillin-binding protein 2 [Deltaproteobacteria bacterium GWC2_66_88]OGP80234.1 MAG: penicillin-binding protein 2 [Deltaproteobacteria bacterium RBG_16_66_15]